jgi:hypothetical protein
MCRKDNQGSDVATDTFGTDLREKGRVPASPYRIAAITVRRVTGFGDWSGWQDAKCPARGTVAYPILHNANVMAIGTARPNGAHI